MGTLVSKRQIDVPGKNLTRTYLVGITHFDSNFFPVFFKNFFFFQLFYECYRNFKKVYILRINTSRSTKWCEFLGSKIFNFPVNIKILQFFSKITIFLDYRNIKHFLKYDIITFCRFR